MLYGERIYIIMIITDICAFTTTHLCLGSFSATLVSFQILGWDEQAFYVEQRFVRHRDQFICAVVFLKQSLKGISPGQVVADIEGRHMESPQLPEEVQLWIECNRVSSARLKKSA